MSTAPVESLRRDIARHERARREAMTDPLGERLLTSRREAIAAARVLMEAHQRLANMYEVLLRALENPMSAGAPEDVAAIRVQIRAQRVLIRASVSQLADSTNELRLLSAQSEPLAGVSAESLADDEVAAALKKALGAALTDERREVRRALELYEWSDLPVYHGGDSRSRDHCLHCGGGLKDTTKTFCSVHCRDVHQSVFGALEGESSDEVDEN